LITNFAETVECNFLVQLVEHVEDLGGEREFPKSVCDSEDDSKTRADGENDDRVDFCAGGRLVLQQPDDVSGQNVQLGVEREKEVEAEEQEAQVGFDHFALRVEFVRQDAQNKADLQEQLFATHLLSLYVGSA